jgi:ATP-dependent Lon protease
MAETRISLKYKILSLQTSQKNRDVIYSKYQEFALCDKQDKEYHKVKNWLVWATSIPHDYIKNVQVNDMNLFITNARERLNEKLYGMEKVKEQILLFISAKIRNPNMIHSNLGLIGPPGTGKTAIARLIADIMDWGFAQIAFGGVEKASFLRGHDYTYVDSQPGEIVKCLKHIGHKNGVMFLDEVDKVANNPDVRAALLHMIDPTQNTDFHDLFLSEISIDLSQIWYIGSMNKVPEAGALADRWWMIHVEGYNHNEKVQIIQKYLLPTALKNCGLDANAISISNDATGLLINKVCKHNDKGVRSIEKAVKDLVNKVSFLVTHQDEKGKLPFKTSFDVNRQLVYPVCVDKELVDKLVMHKEDDISAHMYT